MKYLLIIMLLISAQVNASNILSYKCTSTDYDVNSSFRVTFHERMRTAIVRHEISDASSDTDYVVTYTAPIEHYGTGSMIEHEFIRDNDGNILPAPLQLTLVLGSVKQNIVFEYSVKYDAKLIKFFTGKCEKINFNESKDD